jgi:hypothetical protein
MGWTKLFGNNTQALHEPESWSRTPLDNMTGVELIHNDKKLAIYGPGQFWQSDSFECEVVPFGAPPVRLTHRRIEKFIDKDFVGMYIEDKFGLTFDFRDSALYTTPKRKIFAADLYELPYWLILELDIVNNKTTFYSNKERI